jgi:hypothetical protein
MPQTVRALTIHTLGHERECGALRYREATHDTSASGIALIGALTALTVGVGFAIASIPDASGVLHACYQENQGQLRLVEAASNCRPSEKATSWSQTGPPGPPGPPGTPGLSFLAGSSGGQLSTGNNGSGCGGLIGVGSCAQLGNTGLVRQVIPVSGTLHDLYVTVSAAPGTGVHERWALNRQRRRNRGRL